jgi:hypothetical protein
MNVPKSKLGLIVGLIIAVAAVVFVIVLLSGTKQETEVLITDTQIEITGQYGVTYQISEVAQVRLESTIPNINRKVNGSSLGSIRKGNFEVEGLGRCRLFIHAQSGPFVYILVENSYTIINFEDINKTEKLYEDLVEIVE